MNKKMVFVALAAVAIVALGSLGVAYATSLNGRVFGGSLRAGSACSAGGNAGAGCAMQGAKGANCPMQNNASGASSNQSAGCPMSNAGSTQGAGGCCAAN